MKRTKSTMTNEEKKLAKKVGLIDAAFELFSRKGIKLTAVDDVTKAAGVAKGTFYLYFKDKYDLLDQIIITKGKSVISDALESLKKVSAKTKPQEKLILFTDSIIDSLKKETRLVMLIQKNLSAFHAIILSKENSAFIKGTNSLEEIFTEGGFDERDAEKYIYLLFMMIGSACCDALILKDPFTVEEIRPNIHNIINSLFFAPGESGDKKAS